MARKVISDELKNEIINYYSSNIVSLSRIEEKYDLSHPTISKILKDVPKHKKALVLNPNLKEDYFKNIDCEEKAYFLGLIIADGNVFAPTDGRQHSVSIVLDSADEYILERFRKELNATTSITHDGRGCSQIAVRSDKMADDLAKYGVIPRKSFITYLPEMDDDMMRHVLRGILDGDGSIKAKQSNIRNRYAHAISYCGSHRLMVDISEWCKKHNINNAIVYDYKDKNLSELKIQSINEMYVFGEMIYQDATIYLTRKKTLYDDFKAHYDL